MSKKSNRLRRRVQILHGHLGTADRRARQRERRLVELERRLAATEARALKAEEFRSLELRVWTDLTGDQRLCFTASISRLELVRRGHNIRDRAHLYQAVLEQLTKAVINDALGRSSPSPSPLKGEELQDRQPPPK